MPASTPANRFEAGIAQPRRVRPVAQREKAFVGRSR